MEMILDKKYVWVIFFFEFKVAHKLAGTTWIPRIHLVQELLANRMQWWLKRFCKSDKNLDREQCSHPLEIENDRLSTTIQTDPLTTLRERTKKLHGWHSITVIIRSKTEKTKMPIFVCLMSWPDVKQNSMFNCPCLTPSHNETLFCGIIIYDG